MEFQTSQILPNFNMPNGVLSFIFSTPILLIILIIFFVFYVILSGVLMYHWSAYGMKNTEIFVVESLYIFVSLILFGMASLALYYF